MNFYSKVCSAVVCMAAIATLPACGSSDQSLQAATSKIDENYNPRVMAPSMMVVPEVRSWEDDLRPRSSDPWESAATNYALNPVIHRRLRNIGIADSRDPSEKWERYFDAVGLLGSQCMIGFRENWKFSPRLFSMTVSSRWTHADSALINAPLDRIAQFIDEQRPRCQ